MTLQPTAHRFHQSLTIKRIQVGLDLIESLCKSISIFIFPKKINLFSLVSPAATWCVSPPHDCDLPHRLRTTVRNYIFCITIWRKDQTVFFPICTDLKLEQRFQLEGKIHVELILRFSYGWTDCVKGIFLCKLSSIVLWKRIRASKRKKIFGGHEFWLLPYFWEKLEFFFPLNSCI